MSRWVIAGSWLADNNYGDIILIFPLHPDLQKFCGIDLSQHFSELTKDQAQMYVGVWLRNTMGLSPSPYASIQGALWAKQIITTELMGHCHEEQNAYEWEHILENLPFSRDYIALLRICRNKRGWQSVRLPRGCVGWDFRTQPGKRGMLASVLVLGPGWWYCPTKQSSKERY